MKKTVIFLMCILLAVGVAAQSHSFSDTSYVKYRQFDLAGFISDTTEGLVHSINQMGGPTVPGDGWRQQSLSKDDIVQYNYTASPDGMRVAGISAVYEFMPDFTRQTLGSKNGS